MKIDKIFEKITTEKLSIKAASKLLNIPYSTLHYHLKDFCKRNAKKMPRGKAGRPSRVIFKN